MATKPEVSTRLLHLLVEAGHRRGLDLGHLFDGLSFDAGHLSRPLERVSAAEAGVLLDRLCMAAGRRRLDALVEEALTSSLAMRMAAACLGPERLYHFMAEQFLAAMNRHMSCTVEPAGTGRLQVEIRLRPGFEANLATWQVLGACVRAWPCVLGLPPAKVESSLSPSQARFLLQIPDASRFPACGEQTIRGVLEALLSAGDRRELLVDFENLLTERDYHDEAQEVGELLACCATDAELTAEVGAFFRDRLSCSWVRLWRCSSSGEQLVGVLGAPGGDVFRHSLTLAERTVGAVETDLPAPFRDGSLTLLDAILPWIAVALDRLARPPGATVPATKSQTLRRMAQEYGLTDRQRLVLSLLADGLANKDIAAKINVSPRTVEAHVSHLLRRLGLESRAALLAHLVEAARRPVDLH